MFVLSVTRIKIGERNLKKKRGSAEMPITTGMFRNISPSAHKDRIHILF